MKEKAARIFLSVAILMLVMGSAILGHAPEWFAAAAAFALLAAIFGIRWVRRTAALLVLLSIAIAISEHQAKQQLKQRIQAIRNKN